ncbi:MAG: autotransporter domain-containing protein [Bradyrhizobium sp.]|nr:autotransporter domain-containing protein [Bradyrhizobium sp.]
MADRWSAVSKWAAKGAALAILSVPSAVEAADVEITSNTSSVNLDGYSGSTAHIASGVTVGPSSPSISATLQAWSVTNNGTVSGGNSVTLNQGGTFLNASGATLTGTATAITFGYKPFGLPPAGGPGTMENYGTIVGGVEGVTMWFGGTVNNYLGGTIKTNTGVNAVSIGQGASRTLFNAGVIESNKTTGFSTGVLMQGGPVSFTNTSSGVIYGDYNGVYGSATAVFTTFSNAGSIKSSRGPAVEAAGGGTFVNSGVIESGTDGMLIGGSGATSVTNSGTIRSNGSGRAIAFTGSATHTLTLQTGSVLGGNVQGGSGTDNLVLQGTGTETIAKFLSFENLTMNGADWTLNGTGTFSTGTTVQAGTLRVAGQLTTPGIAVQSGGTLSGTGTVVGNVNNSGSVRVDSGTTLTINGNYLHQAGAYFLVGVTPSAGGLLSIVGAGHTATINGGTVSVVAGPGTYALNTQYTILTAAGGRSGSFGGVTSNFAFLDPSLTYDANNVYLSLARNSADFESVARTFNQRSTAGGLSALSLTDPIVSAALYLSPDQARVAFDNLSGEIYPSLRSLLFDNSALVRDAILGRQRLDAGQARGATAIAWAADDNNDRLTSNYAGGPRAAKAPRWPINANPSPVGAVYGAWVQGYGNWTRLNGDGNAATLRASTGGAIGGVDVTLDRSWRFGLAGGGGRSEASVDSRASSGTIDTMHVAAYGGGSLGDVMIRTGVAYSGHDIDTTRMVAFPGFADRTTANYTASTGQVFGEAAYRVPSTWLNAEAFANIAYVNVRSDSFAETGGAAALSVRAGNASTTFTTLGLRGQAALGTIGGWSLSARGSFGWQHAFDTPAPLAWMSFAASPEPFAVAGIPIASNMALIEAGFGALSTSSAQISLLYSSRIAADASAHAIKANLAVPF